MTKRDFFTVLIKVFGLYSIIVSLFSILPTSISYISLDYLDLTTIILFIFSIGVGVLLFVLLIFKAPYVTEKLNLEKGFDDEKIEIGNISPENIIRLSCLLLGGYLIIHGIPIVLNLLFFALKFDQEGVDFGFGNNFDLGVGILNMLIGYLLINNHSWIAKRLNKSPNK